MVHQGIIQSHIDYFLNCVANWTPRWFNKPKFHIILHLVEHIRRFGPPLLFATETFESFNALIRTLSVHSNRQAPSRDIATGFANSNRIRHLSSGGKFFTANKVLKSSENTGGAPTEVNVVNANSNGKISKIPSADDFQVVGEEVRMLLERQDRVFLSAFGGPQPRAEGD